MFSNKEIQEFCSRKTPFYHYDLSLLHRTLKEVQLHALDHGFHVHYAMKANFNDRILDEIKSFGLGVDAVSANEVDKALAAGFESKHVVFAGVGKTDSEIERALAHDIFCFNCESGQELEIIEEIAGRMGKNAKIALRINPNVDPKTHKFITTGLAENKFGINPWELDDVMSVINASNHLDLVGIHFHIGSQVMDISRYQLLCEKVNEIQNWFDNRGVVLHHINVGGGLGIDYNNPEQHEMPDLKSYFDIFRRHLDLRSHQQLHFELGRALVGQCGSIISKVLYIKPAKNTTFVIIDAGMTELIRPALYQAYHQIDNLTGTGPEQVYDIVGPICETSDAFLRGIHMTNLKRGDLVAIRSAGAYGEVMSSRYNMRDQAESYFSA